MADSSSESNEVYNTYVHEKYTPNLVVQHEATKSNVEESSSEDVYVHSQEFAKENNEDRATLHLA